MCVCLSDGLTATDSNFSNPDLVLPGDYIHNMQFSLHRAIVMCEWTVDILFGHEV